MNGIVWCNSQDNGIVRNLLVLLIFRKILRKHLTKLDVTGGEASTAVHIEDILRGF